MVVAKEANRARADARKGEEVVAAVVAAARVRPRAAVARVARVARVAVAVAVVKARER